VIRALAAGERRRLYARSLDGKRAGFLVLRGDETGRVTLKLQPAASVKGRLVSSGGKPLAGVRFQVAYEDGPGRPGLLLLEHLAIRMKTKTETKLLERTGDEAEHLGARFQTTTGATDAQGRFHIGGLIPGLAFVLKAQLRVPPDSKKPQAQTILMVPVGRLAGLAGKTTDLGELRVRELGK
jgi:hypothetical protein